jgi:uncharacterized protein DUF1236
MKWVCGNLGAALITAAALASGQNSLRLRAEESAAVQLAQASPQQQQQAQERARAAAQQQQGARAAQQQAQQAARAAAAQQQAARAAAQQQQAARAAQQQAARAAAQQQRQAQEQARAAATAAQQQRAARAAQQRQAQERAGQQQRQVQEQAARAAQQRQTQEQARAAQERARVQPQQQQDQERARVEQQRRAAEQERTRAATDQQRANERRQGAEREAVERRRAEEQQRAAERRSAPERFGQPRQPAIGQLLSAKHEQLRQERVRLSGDQRLRLRQAFPVNRDRLTRVQFTRRIGTRIPRSVTLFAVPAAVLAIFPYYRDYRYVVEDDTICVVDPDTYEIVDVLDEGGYTPGFRPQVADLTLTESETAYVLGSIPPDFPQAPLRLRLALGAEIPASVELYEFAPIVLERVTKLSDFRFVVSEDQLVIVAPQDHSVALVLDR